MRATTTQAAGGVDPRPLLAHVIHRLAIGGMETGLVNLVNHMPAERWRHLIVCVEDADPAFQRRIQRADVEVLSMHRSRIGARALRAGLRRLWQARQPDIVHGRNLSGLDAMVPAWRAGVPCRLHSEHGWDMDNLRGAAWKPALLKRLHAPFIQHYLTVSRDLQRFLQQRIGIAAARITHVCNGVDVQRFAPGEVDRQALGAPASHRAPGAVVFGTVGRLQAVKDQATLLRALAEARRLRPALAPRLRATVVGDGPLAAELAGQVQALGLADAVWLAGASDRVAEHLRAMDVFVLPSLNEGISNTLLEAMASGLPLLASAVGGNLELVSDGENGRLLRAGDVASLAAAMLALAEDEALRRRWAEGARAAACQRFSLQAMVAGYEAVYRRLLTKHAPQRLPPTAAA